MKTSKLWWHVCGDAKLQFLNFLNTVQVGELFIYKVHICAYNDENVTCFDQYAVMNKTLHRYSPLELYDLKYVDVINFYDPADMFFTLDACDEYMVKTPILFDSLDDPELNIRLAIIGKTPYELPLFETQYYDKNIFYVSGQHVLT